MKTGILFGMGLGMLVGAFVASYCPKVSKAVKDCTEQVENMVSKKNDQQSEQEDA